MVSTHDDDLGEMRKWRTVLPHAETRQQQSYAGCCSSIFGSDDCFAIGATFPVRRMLGCNLPPPICTVSTLGPSVFSLACFVRHVPSFHHLLANVYLPRQRKLYSTPPSRQLFESDYAWACSSRSAIQTLITDCLGTPSRLASRSRD